MFPHSWYSSSCLLRVIASLLLLLQQSFLCTGFCLQAATARSVTTTPTVALSLAASPTTSATKSSDKNENNNKDQTATIVVVVVANDAATQTHENTPCYEIIAQQPCGKADRVVPLAAQAFGFDTHSQARKACRWGEIVILLTSGDDDDDDDDDDDQQQQQTTLAVDLFDLASRAMIGNRTVVVVDPLSTARSGHVLARIARRVTNASCCYPQSATGFVQPPPIMNDNDEAESLRVVYQDEYLAVVDKPAGLVTMGVPRQDLQSCLPFVLQPPSNTIAHGDFYLPRPVHRLDRRTRGLVLVAKDATTMAALSRAFADRQVYKTYTALVFGQVLQDCGTIDYPIDDKPAISDWQVLQRGPHFTLLHVHPRTGRNHQIRRHLAYCLGHPIVGDNKYDGGHAAYKSFRTQGLYLCATAISFRHPTMMIPQQILNVTLPVPDAFTALLMSTEDPMATSTNENNATINPKQRTLADWVEQARQDLGSVFDIGDEQGVACTGEPSIDPSRMINANQGDSEWMDDW